MQTIASQLEQAFRTAIQAALGFDADPLIGVAQNDKFGDYQANAAMGLAKQVADRTGQKANPRAVAEQIKAKLDLGAMASEVSIAGPGFINVRLSPEWLAKQLQAAAADERVGVPPAPSRDTVVIDYSAPNIAKELHVGHLRSTIIGDAVSRILEFQGHDVVRQNHIGDWGMQFGMLIHHLRTRDAEHESDIEDLEAFYVEAKRRWKEDEGFAEQARQTVVRLQAGEAEELRLWRRIIDETRRHYQPIYDRLKVKLTPQDERGESFYNPFLADVVRELAEAGIARESEGAIAVFTEGYGSPLIIEKTGGGYGYGTTDLAAIRYRVRELKARRIIYFVDARQAQHFAQVFDAARRAGWATDVLLEHAAFGTVLVNDGRPFKSSEGGTEKLEKLLDKAEARALDVVNEKNAELPEGQRREIARVVGIGAVKYADLSKDRMSDYLFSYEAMLALNGNTGPYMQYAHARIRSIFREAARRGVAFAGPGAAVPITLASPYEVALAKQVLRLGEVVNVVARELKPHHLCAYLYDLATQFSGFFENCPVLQSEDPVRASRLALCDVVARTLALGMDLLGIEHPEQM